MLRPPNCHLCLSDSPTIDSHVFPKFWFRHVRREGGHGFRRPSIPNQLLQDGPKHSLLCYPCDGLKVGKRETRFAAEFFHPWMDERRLPANYTSDTHYFLISILWRHLLVASLDPRAPDDRARPWLPKLREVQEDWRRYLNGETAAPCNDDIHMLVMDVLPTGHPQPITHINRYAVGTLDSSVVFEPDRCLVFVKFGLFAVFGLLAGFDTTLWHNTRILSTGGPFITPQRILDPIAGKMITIRARRSAEMIAAGLSPRQQRLNQNRARPLTGNLALAHHADHTAPIDPTMGRSSKIKRNELCPCGSGQKFKHCHGR